MCPRCKKAVDSHWLEAWGFDVLETKNPVEVGDCSEVPVAQDSGLAVQKRTASFIPENEIPPKMAKTSLGASPLAGKAHHSVLSPIPPNHYIWAMPCFMNRPQGSPHTEAVAAAVRALAFHNK